LASRGYTVLRFTNDDVLRSLEGVLILIRHTAMARVKNGPPSLSLPRKGGGNRHTSSSRVSKVASSTAIDCALIREEEEEHSGRRFRASFPLAGEGPGGG
jgi:hypothetical protein